MKKREAEFPAKPDVFAEFVVTLKMWRELFEGNDFASGILKQLSNDSGKMFKQACTEVLEKANTIFAAYEGSTPEKIPKQARIKLLIIRAHLGVFNLFLTRVGELTKAAESEASFTAAARELQRYHDAVMCSDAAVSLVCSATAK